MKETPAYNTIHQEVQQLVEQTTLVSLFAKSDGRALASVTNGEGRREIIAVRSVLFRDWLARAHFRKHDGLPSVESIAAAVKQIEQRALSNQRTARPEGPRRVKRGTNEDGSDSIIIQLGNSLADYVVITRDGWRTVENLEDDTSGRSTTMLALPRPEQPHILPSVLNAIRSMLRVSNEENWRACLTWLVAAVQPSGPYPILLLRGVGGSGKSTIAALLRGLIDPSSSGLCRLSTIDRSIRQLTSFNWVVALAGLAAPFSHLSEALLQVANERPVILTTDSGSGWKGSPELMKRALVVNLDPLRDKERCSETELWARYRTVRPQMLGVLCSIASAGLSAGAVDGPSWLTASEQVVGHVGSRTNSLSGAIYDLMQTRDEWSGRTTELLRVLEATHPASTAGSRTPKELSDRVNAALAAIRNRGVRSGFAHGRILLRRSTPLTPVM